MCSNQGNFPVCNRVRVEDFLEDGEEENLCYNKNDNVPIFYRGELTMMIEENDETSSFSDDGIPDSELELFSSDFQESEAGEYIPPLTRTKKRLIKYLVENKIHETDDEDTQHCKQVKRCKLLRIYRNNILKKRAVKAYRRMLKAHDMGCETPEQKAFCLEKMEIKDKKLNRSFYFETIEPFAYKKLLKKRKRAIRRKYELYALDCDYRKKYEARLLRNIGNVKCMAEEEEELTDSEEQSSEDVAEEEECDVESDESTTSSFYDTDIPQSEKEYFSSDFNDEPEVPYLGPKSYTLAKRKRLLKTCKVNPQDDDKVVRDKMLSRAEINAQFKNFIETKRATKALIRMQTIHAMNLTCIDEIAKHLYDMEIMDKKLHHSFYFDPSEPEIYKILLAKRRRAVARKYEKFKCDKKFQLDLEENIYSNFMRTQVAPLFEDSDAETDDSSFNDSEVPTSEEEFMSCESLILPNNYAKPLTRTKETLYEELENYEPDLCADTPSTINLKRRMRLETLKRYKEDLLNRRKLKALIRTENCFKVSNDPGIQANYLMSAEIADKKLDKGYYYCKDEPMEYKMLLDKRLRAIKRKYQLFVKHHAFRNHMKERIHKAARKVKGKKNFKKSLKKDESQEDTSFDEGYSPDDESEDIHEDDDHLCR